MHLIRNTLLVAAVLACAPVAAAPVGKAAPRGLAHVPGDAFAFIHLNIGELNQNALFRLVRQSQGKGLPPMLDDFTQQSVGIPLEEVEGFTFVVLSGGPDVILVATAKPIDSKKTLERLFARGPAPQETTHAGKKVYFRSGGFTKPRPGEAAPREARLNPWGQAVCFLDERVVAVGMGMAVTGLLDRAARADDRGPLNAALEQVTATRHHFSAGLQVPAEMTKEMEQELGRHARHDPIHAAVLANLRPLFKARVASAMGSLGETTTARLRVQFSSEEAARAGQESARFALSLMTGLFSFGRDQLAAETYASAEARSRLGELWAQVEKGLTEATVKVDGRELRVDAEAKVEEKKVREVLTVLVPDMQRAALRMQSMNNLKQLGLAMHNFHDSMGRMPLAAWQGQQMQPPQVGAGLSWRVALLPYIEEEALYRQFKLDEPWDSDHNKKLIARMPRTYAAPGRQTKEPGLTYYRVFTGNMAAFPDRRPRRLFEFADGTSNTFLVVEAGEPVIWTKPDELEYDPKKPVPKLGGVFEDGFHACFGDGAVRFIKAKLPDEVLRAYITAQGGEVVPGFDDDEFRRPRRPGFKEEPPLPRDIKKAIPDIKPPPPLPPGVKKDVPKEIPDPPPLPKKSDD